MDYVNRISMIPQTGNKPATIEDAKSDDDIERVAAAIRVLREKQLARGDVQRRLGEIFERRISREGRR